MVHQPPGQVQLADAAAAPVDDLGGQHAADAEFLAEAEQQHVDPGRVHVGQLGQVADAHQHLGLGIAAAHFQVAAQRGREAEADRLEHRIDAERHAPAVAALSTVRVQPFERGRHVGHGDDFAAPRAGRVHVAAVDAQDQLGPGGHGRLDLARR